MSARTTPRPADADVDLAELTERPGPGSHRTVVDRGDRRVTTLADLPPLRNGLLFVGLHPSPESVAAGHYHQGVPGEQFWSRLVAAGILPAGTIAGAADDALVAAGHGITDLLKEPTGPTDASDAELTAGVGVLWQKVAIWRPAAVVFVFRRAASIAAGRPLGEPFGLLAGGALAARPCFLMPDADAPPDDVDAGLDLLRRLATALPSA